jgi:hypothetical protein
MTRLTSDEHDADGEDLLRVSVRGDVAKPNGREAAEREVEGGDVPRLEKRICHYRQKKKSSGVQSSIKVKVRVKLKLFLCLTKRHAMKTYPLLNKHHAMKTCWRVESSTHS